jgi:hypothetical protein
MQLVQPVQQLTLELLPAQYRVLLLKTRPDGLSQLFERF